MNGLAVRIRALPYVLAFFSSLCIMILELVASRLVARHVGASLSVWTSVIGIMLGGICLGNVLGGRLADRIGAKRSILIALVGYIGICVWAAQVHETWEFVAMALMVGMVQGGAQALSRSLFASLVPKHKSGGERCTGTSPARPGCSTRSCATLRPGWRATPVRPNCPEAAGGMPWQGTSGRLLAI